VLVLDPRCGLIRRGPRSSAIFCWLVRGLGVLIFLEQLLHLTVVVLEEGDASGGSCGMARVLPGKRSTRLNDPHAPVLELI
jgi:hypothetical protein